MTKAKPLRELEYLESTGTQWIDTGYAINTATDEITFTFELLETNMYKWFFGEYDENNRIGLGSGDGTDKRNFLYQQPATKVADTKMYNGQHVYKADSTGGYLDGTKIVNYSNFASTSSIYLFNLNISSTSDYRCRCRIWNYQHKRNNELILDLVPAFDQNKVPCMYL